VPVPPAKITSGESATNSFTNLRMRSASAAVHRVSIRTLRPSIQPSCCNPCEKARKRGIPSRSSSLVPPISTPIRRIRSVCCARAATGHVAAPLMRVMNSSHGPLPADDADSSRTTRRRPEPLLNCPEARLLLWPLCHRCPVSAGSRSRKAVQAPWLAPNPTPQPRSDSCG
jgi:hypothetical protein